MRSLLTSFAIVSLALIPLAGCKNQQEVRRTAPPPLDIHESTSLALSNPEPAPAAPAPSSPTVEFAPVAPAPSAPAVSPQPAAGRVHTVQKGDTLWRLATLYYGNGQRWPDIARANSIADPSKLRIGQTLVIP